MAQKERRSPPSSVSQSVWPYRAPFAYCSCFIYPSGGPQLQH